MSGHSKWAQIKHKKAATDKKRGNLFSKLTRAITIAAREGADPAMNARLRLLIQRAREVNMPAENIERAIAKSDPAKSDTQLFEVVYETYAPGGAALLIEGITDNKNRTAAEIRHLVSEYGGKWAEAGTVSWMFEKKGVITLAKDQNPALREPEAELLLIDAGAEEISESDDAASLIVPLEKRNETVERLKTEGFTPLESYDAFVPNITPDLTPDALEKAERLIEALEDHDDVQEVWSNLPT